MTQIAVVGMGFQEEAVLLSMNYTFSRVRPIDSASTVDFTRFKVLIFPSRLAVFDMPVFQALKRRRALQDVIRRFVNKGGRVVVFPPLELPSDWSSVRRDMRAMSIPWLPFRCTIRMIRYRLERVRVAQLGDEPRLPRTSLRVRRYCSFETPGKTRLPWILGPGGDAAAFRVSVGRGDVLICPYSLAGELVTPSDRMEVPRFSQVFHAAIRWGLAHPSLALTWDLGPLPRRYSRLQPIARGVDMAVSEGNHREAALRSWKVIEQILRSASSSPRASAKSLVASAFQGPSAHSDGEVTWYVAEALRVLRNRLTHEEDPTTEEIPADDADFFLSGARFVCRGLLENG